MSWKQFGDLKEMGGDIYDLVLSKRETEAGRWEDKSKWFLSCSSPLGLLWVTAGTGLGCAWAGSA